MRLHPILRPILQPLLRQPTDISFGSSAPGSPSPSLLMEDGGFLLLESGDNLLLE